MNGSVSPQRRRILSIDGGGVRGLLSARVLSHVESRLRERGALHPLGLAHHFDLLAGTSSGAILAMGLASGRSAAQIEAAFQSDAPRIFASAWWSRCLRPLFAAYGASYAPHGLAQVLREWLGDTPLGQLGSDRVPDAGTCTGRARPLLMATAYDMRQVTTRFFKSWKPGHSGLLAREVAMGSAAAPSYFPPQLLQVPQIEDADPPPAATLMDGALFANNPAMSAWAEARQLWPQDEICILSVGSGEHQDTCDASAPGLWNRAALVRCAFNAMLDGQSDAVDYQLKRLYAQQAPAPGPQLRGYLRLQIDLLQARSDALDDASAANLEGLVADANRLTLLKAPAIAQFLAEVWP